MKTESSQYDQLIDAPIRTNQSNSGILGKRFSSQGPQSSRLQTPSNPPQQQSLAAFNLEQIFGMTVQSSHQIAINPITSDIAYTAGSVVVIYSPTLNQQIQYLQSSSKTQIYSVLFSHDGEWLYAGEGTCKSPIIGVWDLKITNRIQTQPAGQLIGHKFGINQMIQSPSNYRYLVSLGGTHDRGLFVWDINTLQKITVNKLSKSVHCIRFDSTGRLLVSCGQQHLKLWYFREDGQVIKHSSDKEDIYLMEPKSVLLTEKFLEKTFVDLVIYEAQEQNQVKLFAMTKDSLLCIFNEYTRQLDRWMDLKTTYGFGLALLYNHIICACSDSIIRVFNADTFSHITTLHKPPNLGNYNIEKGVTKLKQASPGDLYADCVGICVDPKEMLLCVTYSDRTFFVWDVKQWNKVSVKRSFLNHSGPIYDLQILPLQSSEEVTFFVTASADKTMRIWHYYDEQQIQHNITQDISSIIGIRRNVYCKNLSKILYVSENDFKHFKRLPNSSDDQALQDLTNQVKCVKLSKDGNYLACGDMLGVLRVYSTQTFTKEYEIQAHEQEIMTLDFAPPNELGLDFLATGARDRLIHVFDVSRNFEKICTLDEHTASIMQIRFGFLKEFQRLILISCSVDRSIIFRDFVGGQKSNKKSSLFSIYHQEVEKSSKILSIELSFSHQLLYVGTDKRINLFNTTNGKLKQSWESRDEYKINNFENLKMSFDYSGQFMAVYNSDRVVRIRDTQNFNYVAKLKQGDTISGMIYAINNKNFITAGYDGCIFVWKISQEVKTHIEKKKGQLGIIARKLKEVLQDQELKMSKEWTINSFWIEEELRGFLNNQKEPDVSLISKINPEQQSQLVDNPSKCYPFEKLIQSKPSSEPVSLFCDKNQDQVEQSQIQQQSSKVLEKENEVQETNNKIKNNNQIQIQYEKGLSEKIESSIQLDDPYYQSNKQENDEGFHIEVIDFDEDELNLPRPQPIQLVSQQEFDYKSNASIDLCQQIEQPPHELKQAFQIEKESNFSGLNQIKEQMQKVQNFMTQGLKQLEQYKRQTEQSIVDPKHKLPNETTETFIPTNTQEQFNQQIDEIPSLKDEQQQTEQELISQSEFYDQVPHDVLYETKRYQGLSRESINLNQSLPEGQQIYGGWQQQEIIENQQQMKNSKGLALKYSNLLDCHIKSIVSEFQQMQDVLIQIQQENDKEIQTQISSNLKDSFHDLKQSIENLNESTNQVLKQRFLSSNDILVDQSAIDSSRLPEQEIRNIVAFHSRDILDNYSKLLFQEISKKFQQMK